MRLTFAQALTFCAALCGQFEEGDDDNEESVVFNVDPFTFMQAIFGYGRVPNVHRIEVSFDTNNPACQADREKMIAIFRGAADALERGPNED